MMTSSYRKGYVYVQNQYAGSIEETDEGYSFAYSQEYLNGDGAIPVSLTLPLSLTTYKSTVLFPFFDGLIPEGWLLEAVTRNWKISAQDRFGLLLVTCRDCIGDVSIKNEVAL